MADPSPAPQFTGARPAVHADHLGASTYIEKGWSLISLGDYGGAIQALEKALTLSPGAVEAQSLLGWAQMLNEDYDDALGNFSKVLMKEPANALARINVGYICLKKGIFGEAIEHLSKAIRLDNDRKATLYAHYYLGLVYLEREMYEDAQSFLRKTLKLGPNLIEAYFELGRALWLGGEREEAVHSLDRRVQGQQVQSMGQAVPGNVGSCVSRRRSPAQSARLAKSRSSVSLLAARGRDPGSSRQPCRVGQVTAVAWPRAAEAGHRSGPAGE